MKGQESAQANDASSPLAETAAISPMRRVRADLHSPRGALSTMPKRCVGAGRVAEGLRADWQRQLAYVKRECDFGYLRMHGLLGDELGVYREDAAGHAEFNFQYIDEVYDFLLRIGVKPFVEIGFCPSALASGSKTIFWWKGNVSPPKDMAKWHALIVALVRHFTERYGEAEVATWYFEVWNEPNLAGFFDGTQADYFELFARTACAIKAVSSAYRVGGPATAGCAWVPELIEYCARHAVPIDFISTHDYAVEVGHLDETGTAGTILSHDPRSIFGNVLAVREQIAASALPELELHFTEWSSSYTPADPLHDSYHSAAFVLDKLKKSGTAADSMSYWVFTDIFEEAGPRFTPFHGGFGLLNYQDIRKPVFFAYQFFNRLGPVELTCEDASSYVTRDAAGNVQVLLWDFTVANPERGENNQIHYKRLQPARAKSGVKVELSNLTPGEYTQRVYQVGYRVNDAYTVYLDLGAPAQLTRKQVEQLNAASDGKPSLETSVVVGGNGRFECELELRENDVCLIVVERNEHGSRA
jgi:xylan 1,4-beta-xylosidase